MNNFLPTQPQDATPAIENRRHWLGLPLMPQLRGSITDIQNALPHFGRQPFAMASVNTDEVGINLFLDMVYRMGTRQAEKSIPVGVVSKNYRLVDHHHVISTVEQVLIGNKIDVAKLEVAGEWTVYGERAHFSFLFPAEDRFIHQVNNDGDDMRFRLEIFNSVDGSCRLMAVAGWLRFVCSNGLIVGSALMDLRQQHRQQLQIEEMGRLLRAAIQNTEGDKSTFEYWSSHPIDPLALIPWIDEEVCKQWGLKAAVRVLAIVKDGCDVIPVGSVRDRRPSEIETEKLGLVPGIDGPVENIFGVGQVLSWCAGQRAELAENLEWRSQVPDLIDKLLDRSRKARRNDGLYHS